MKSKRFFTILLIFVLLLGVLGGVTRREKPTPEVVVESGEVEDISISLEVIEV